jgi:hypothetical protein
LIFGLFIWPRLNIKMVFDLNEKTTLRGGFQGQHP